MNMIDKIKKLEKEMEIEKLNKAKEKEFLLALELKNNKENLERAIVINKIRRDNLLSFINDYKKLEVKGLNNSKQHDFYLDALEQLYFVEEELKECGRL